MTINYTVTGIQRNFGMPGMIGANGQPTPPAPSYNATLQLVNTGQFMGVSQFTVTIGADKLSLYQIDAEGEITIGDPSAPVPHDVPKSQDGMKNITPPPGMASQPEAR